MPFREPHHAIRTRYVTAMWARPFDAAWIRVFGWGVSIVDHRRMRPLFSERYNGTHGIKKRLYVHVGPWCIKFLRPERRKASALKDGAGAQEEA